MRPLDDVSPTGSCPASAVVMAARLAKTPLAIADACVPGAPIMFANDAFAELVGCDPVALQGRALESLGPPSTPVAAPIAAGVTRRLEITLADGRSFPAALSVAAVAGADGAAFCFLCSLVDARGDGADAAIVRDADLLSQVARAASDLMSESGAAAALSEATGRTDAAGEIALDAVTRVVGDAARAAT